MKEKSLVKNVIFNSIYTGLNILFPLITAPYVSRVLGASNLGLVNFAASFVNWFVIIAAFGTATYGVREIAKNKNDQSALNKVFSEIMIINTIMSLLMFFIYIVIILYMTRFQSDLTLYGIMSLTLLLNMFSIDWFYQGLEEYGYITIRNVMFKVISIISIFIFIRNSQDYTIYGLISILATSLSGILNVIYSRKFVKFSFKNVALLKHIPRLSIFFSLTLIVSLYTNLDQTLLGLLSTSAAVAYMNRSKTITAAAKALATSISNVTLPRASYYMNTDKKKFADLINVVPNFILWITIPLTIGIMFLSSNIMYILGGNQFIGATSLLQIISPIIILGPLSSFLQNQFLVPTGNERYGLVAAILTSILSVLLNIVLIPRYSFNGAAVTSVVSELFAVLSRIFIIKELIQYKDINIVNKNFYKYCFSALVMGLIIFLIKSIIINPFVELLLSALFGASVYFIMLFLLKEEVTFLLVGKLKEKVKFL
ncbi:flippase [Carnobacterium mobile]|uniref:flippase n=1 Tax=Carnobacterium mobile TaxID=2750 RepID=UPI0005579701|nr:flippase [Carnobacterium mobile]